jgi:2-polyprenyl-3-methyl-5-hydroxy-6-metoxy-1,4-benzoquinol methylase
MDYQNKDDGYYKNLRPEMLSLLPTNAKKILDVGCADASFAETVKKKNNAEVWGIEFMPEIAKKGVSKIDKILIGTIEETISQIPKNYFDVIYFNDVLEHLLDPYNLLEKIKQHLTKDGVVISSIPNVRHHKTFMKLVFKKEWTYESHGILDKTHFRFFTKKSIQSMYEDAGFEIISHNGVNASKSIKPWFYNILFLFTALDMRYLQYATKAKIK